MSISADSRRESLQLDLEEWKRLASTAQRDSVAQVIRDKILSLERQIEAFSGPAPLQSQIPTQSRPSGLPQVQNEIFTPLSNFAWDQTTESIKLYVTVDAVKELPAKNVSVDFDTRLIDMKIRGVPGCPNYQLLINKLNKPIKPDQCKFKVRKNMITITLRKNELLWWDDVKLKEQKVPKMNSHSEKDATDPSASLMKLMKRTIAKAWTESQDKQKCGIPSMDYLSKMEDD